MKKFATVAVLTALAGVAHAQSSVTLFGIVDEAARYLKNGDTKQWSLASGGVSTSRLGVRGVEDLGNDLKAGFWLETGLNPDNGGTSENLSVSGNRFWNRRSTVSLMGNFGEVRLGRDFNPTYLAWEDYDPFGDNGVGAGGKFDANLNGNRATSTRGDNQVQYLTANNLGGFYARISVAPGEGTVGTRYRGGSIGYAAGPLDVRAAYGTTLIAPLSLAGDDQFKVISISGSYDFGMIKPMIYYRRNETGTQRANTYSLGLTAPVGAGQIRASYIHQDLQGAGVDSNDGNQVAVGYLYNLSKRTGLFGTASFLKNKGGATNTVNGSNGSGSAPALLAGQKSTGLEVGIIHRF